MGWREGLESVQPLGPVQDTISHSGGAHSQAPRRERSSTSFSWGELSQTSSTDDDDEESSGNPQDSSPIEASSSLPHLSPVTLQRRQPASLLLGVRHALLWADVDCLAVPQSGGTGGNINQEPGGTGFLSCPLSLPGFICKRGNSSPAPGVMAR